MGMFFLLVAAFALGYGVSWKYGDKVQAWIDSKLPKV